MEIHYDITEEDYLNFNMFHVKNSKTGVRSLNIQRYMGPVIFIVFAFIFSNIANTPFLGSLITFLMLSILWIVFYPKYFYNHVSRHTKKMIQEGKNDGLLGKYHLLLTEESIIEKTTNGETKINWSGIEAFKEDVETFYIYNSAVSAIILPKRSLENVEETRAYIQSKIDEGRGR